jgi:hypothetical protein
MIGGRYIQMEDDGSLVISYGDYGTEPFMNHLAEVAKTMHQPDIEEYKRVGLRHVG